MTQPSLQTKASIEPHIPALRRYARSLARDRDDADDILQTCLERALRHFDQFRPGSNLRGWLFRILRNEFISGLRHRQRRGTTVPLEDWHGETGVAGGQERLMEIRDLSRAFGDLSRRDRQILYLVGVEGRSYEATARLLNVRSGTVKSRLFRARERLRGRLADDAGRAGAARAA
ncbi:MAG: sigma-70 family RNA polymerase sigma factor [Alphaproteobacteria bacterium]|nr:sigma-70 family RNA polymerase sigma factor [Alphaproteobacteria bacterium]